MSIAEWFVWQDGNQVGPITIEELRSMRATGKLRPTGYVWKQGLGTWRRLSDLFPTAPAQPLAALPPNPQPASTTYFDQNLTISNGEAQLDSQEFLLSMIRDISVKTETPVGGLTCLAFGAVLLIPALIHIREPRDGPFYIAIFTVVGMIFALYNVIDVSSNSYLKVVLRNGASVVFHARDKSYLNKLADRHRVALEAAQQISRDSERQSQGSV